MDTSVDEAILGDDLDHDDATAIGARTVIGIAVDLDAVNPMDPALASVNTACLLLPRSLPASPPSTITVLLLDSRCPPPNPPRSCFQ